MIRVLIGDLIRSVSMLLLAGCGCWNDVEQPCHEPVRVTVTRVIDGDTFVVDPPLDLDEGEVDTVRLLCVDSAELGEECYAEEAADWLRERVEGREVRLRFDEDCVDVYGRALAYASIGGTLLNVKIARAGLATTADEWFMDHACCDSVRDAVDRAVERQNGAWGECLGSPWEPPGG